MSSVVIPSSPNWFLNDCFFVASDGYVVYGTLSVGIAILTPSETTFLFTDLRVIHPAHKARVSCLSPSPDWAESRLFASGSDDGLVKLWSAQSLSSKFAHDGHVANQETVVGVAFLDSKVVLSVGSLGFLIAWNVRSNTIRARQKTLKGYKPVCSAPCPHRDGVVAVGTKQGVVVVVKVFGEYDDQFKILFKCPGHDAEITSVSWCPTPECEYFDSAKGKAAFVKKNNKKQTIQNRNKVDEEENSEGKDDADESKAEKNSSKDFLEECGDLLNLIKKVKEKNADKKPNDVPLDDLEEVEETEVKESEAKEKEVDEIEVKEKKVQEKEIDRADSPILDETLNDTNRTIKVDESDIFDMYEDNTMDEFGHTDVRNKEDLAALENIYKRPMAKAKRTKELKEKESNKEVEELSNIISSIDINKDTDSLYLASCCKKGILCVWRWGGTLMMSEEIKIPSKNKFKKKVTHPFGAALWLSANKIIAGAKDSQVVCYTLEEEKTMTYLHSAHKRGLFNVTANSSMDGDKNIVWSVSMDRLLAGYSFEDKTTSVYSTFGGYVYNVQISPIDSYVFAAASGDGMIRVWRLVEDSGTVYGPALLRQIWNGVNGKILGLAWHPTRENVLAFSTLEGKVGVVTGVDAPAQIMPFSQSLSLGVHHVCWAPESVLLACGGESPIAYDTKAKPIVEEKIDVIISDVKWKISFMCWSEKYLTVGSTQGGLALLAPTSPYTVIAASSAHKKAITCIAWHPGAVTTEDEASPWADLVAVSAKATNIVVMRTFEMNGELMLETFRDYTAHGENVTSLCWSPHHNGRLLSTSHDCRVQIWDVLENNLLGTFSGHQDSVLTSAWCTPLPDHVITGSSDCSLRIWDTTKHPPKENAKRRDKLKKKYVLAKNLTNGNAIVAKAETVESSKKAPEEVKSEIQSIQEYEEDERPNMAVLNNSKKLSNRKISPLTIARKQYQRSTLEGCRRLFDGIVARHSGDMTYRMDYGDGYDYLRIFGSHEDVLELLNIEQLAHKETFYWDAWSAVGILKGDLKGVVEEAAEQNRLSSALLSLAPSVSHRFWKDTLAKYSSQLEKDVKDTTDGLCTLGKVWQAALLLSAAQVDEACRALGAHGLEAEAVCAARARHVDHVAERHLRAWADERRRSGVPHKAAECLLALDDVAEAVSVLGQSNDEQELALAAIMAKHASARSKQV